jgi:hypothetical protein
MTPDELATVMGLMLANPVVRWSAPTTTGNSGAPNSPFDSTSHPAFASKACRPAASPVKLAMVAPVV